MKLITVATMLLALALTGTASAGIHRDESGIHAIEVPVDLDGLDMPVLRFSLTGGKMPDYDVILPPEGCTGVSITNNEYVDGSLSISRHGVEVYDSGPYIKKDSGVRLKVRGNTSAAWGGQKVWKHGFKIKLSKKANLLTHNNKTPKSKDWVLLTPHNIHLNPVAGFEIGRICGLGWQPDGCYVNLFVNDVYMGVYYLAEAVTGDKGRVTCDDSGYIIENDPYWWKPDEIYFKSDHLPYSLGWTFKEPDTDDFTETSMIDIRWAVANLEKALYNGSPIDRFIDFRSFAAWVLAHDIMATTDPLGSNIFMVKYDFDPIYPFLTPFRMGPLWDMDTSFQSESPGFAPIHSSSAFYYPVLFRNQEFNRTYIDLWNETWPFLEERLMKYMERFLDDNRDLDRARAYEFSLTGREYVEAAQSVHDLRAWLRRRIARLNLLINGTENPEKIGTGLPDPNSDEPLHRLPDGIPADGGAAWIRSNGVRVYGTDGLPSSLLRPGLNIIEWPDASTSRIVF